MIFAKRARRGPDKYLPWKAAALVAGAVMLLLGNRFGLRWLMWAAIPVLLVGYLLRFLPQGTRDDGSDDSTD